jgi:cyclomaltodextrinase
MGRLSSLFSELRRQTKVRGVGVRAPWRRLLLAIALMAAACGGEPGEPTGEPFLGVPAWSQNAIWYQIFVERFRNGDPGNDPTLHDMRGSWPDMQPEGWAPTPWGHDWYAQEDWAAATGEGFYTTVQLRRYGGDLQGVVDRLDDLRELGVTALYLNPINDAPSLHKYDARNYRHVDRNFGPDPRGDEALMAREDPMDPATWVTTAADSLFLALIREVHQRGMRVIVDYSWNHTGATFWAWQDVLENQAESAFADWYEIERFDDPATPDTSEFTYRGWAGVPNLPELRKVGRREGETHGAIEGTLYPAVRAHVFNVTRRWLDPNGDGDPSDGVDGFRLDVAEMVPLGFWRDYRTFVRSINPEAYLVGEVWWEVWPDRMYDPAPWLQGDVFDAVMNYRWFAPTRSFFIGAPPGYEPDAYLAALDAIESGIPTDHVKAQMNLTASHDTPRIGTSLYNPGRYKFNVGVAGNPDYRLGRPDDRTRRLQRLVLVQQFTWIGAPHVWYGDEVGMWGPDDPDPRKPMVWPDVAYEDEASDPLGRRRRPDPVGQDLELRDTYRRLIVLRKANLELFVDGDVRVLLADPEGAVLAYERVLGEGADARRAVVLFNRSESEAARELPLVDGTYAVAYAAGSWSLPETVTVSGGSLVVALPPLSAGIWIRE